MDSSNGQDEDAERPLAYSTPKRSKLTCQFCGKIYQVRFYFEQHLKSHNLDDSQSSVTASCNGGGNDNNNNSVFKVPNCASTPKRKVQHSTFTCNVCQKQYQVKHYYLQHLKSHSDSNNNRPPPARNDPNCSLNSTIVTADVTFSALNDSAGTFKKPAPKVPKRKPKFICTYCRKGYLDNRAFRSHVRTHIIQEAATRLPDEKKILGNVKIIAKSALECVKKCVSCGTSGSKFKELIDELVMIQNSDEWLHFCKCLCEHLISDVVKKKCFLPSSLLCALLKKVEVVLSDSELCESILAKIILSKNYDDIFKSQFLLEFTLHVTKEIIAYISSILREGLRPPRKLAVELDKEDKEVIFYIGGSIVRGYVRIGYRYPNSASWQEVTSVMKAKLLQDKPTALEVDAAWTMAVDRGGLLYVSSPFQEFLISLTKIVYAHEKKDGSIDFDEVIIDVFNSDTSLVWDSIISDSLEETKSVKLMNDLVKRFAQTCGRGFAKRRLNFLKEKPVISMPTRHAVAKRKK